MPVILAICARCSLRNEWVRRNTILFCHIFQLVISGSTPLSLSSTVSISLILRFSSSSFSPFAKRVILPFLTYDDVVVMVCAVVVVVIVGMNIVVFVFSYYKLLHHRVSINRYTFLFVQLWVQYSYKRKPHASGCGGGSGGVGGRGG